MDALGHDVRYAFRTLAKHRGFTLVALLTLALGIGANAAIFSVLDAVMLRPLGYPDIDRLMILGEANSAGGAMSVSWPNYLDWREQTRAFASLGVYRAAVATLTGGDQPERLIASVVSSDVFRAIGLEPIAGRVFDAAEDRAGSGSVAVLSERLWRSHFAGDPSIVGRVLTIDSRPYTVVGVMPAAMRFPSRLTDIWLPIGTIVSTFPPRGAHPGLIAVGRLKSGVTVPQAAGDMETIARNLAQRYPDSNRGNTVTVTPYYDTVVGNIRPALLVLIVAVGFVLLIGCANLANLMLARSEGRQREIAVRSALGASRGRIVQQLLTESVLLAGGGGALGALLAWWGVRAFVASSPRAVPRIDLVAVDGRVLIFVAAVSIATGLLFGLLPAVKSASLDLVTSLKESVRGSTGARARRLRSALVIAEVSLAVALVVGAVLTAKSFARLMAIDPGFDSSRVVTMRVSLPPAKYPTREQWEQFHAELVQRVAALPGVESAALNSAVPLEGGGAEAPVIAEGDALPSPGRPGTMCLFQATTPDYFRTMGIQMIEGRPFSDRDTAEATPVAVVDEALARRLFPSADPIGRRIAFEFQGGHSASARPIWREVIAVVRHVRHYGLATEPPFVQVYTPVSQLPFWMLDRRPAMALFAATHIEPEHLATTIRREVAAIDRDVPVYAVETMQTYLDENTEQPRLTVVLLGGFGLLALTLSIVGIYGVLSYTVTQRTQEIGIRMALGATRRDVLRLVVGDGMRLVAAGLVIGLVASYGLSRSLAALLYQVSPHDPSAFAATAALLAGVALVASYAPARRASHVSPVVALRDE